MSRGDRCRPGFDLRGSYFAGLGAAAAAVAVGVPAAVFTTSFAGTCPERVSFAARCAAISLSRSACRRICARALSSGVCPPLGNMRLTSTPDQHGLSEYTVRSPSWHRYMVCADAVHAVPSSTIANTFLIFRPL